MIRRHPACMEEQLPIGLLPRGQSAEIVQLIGRPEHVQRLHELGLWPGAQVELVQAGSPCILKLNGQRLCFRETELVGILVRPGVPV